MAKGVINLQKESGGVTKITSTDGVSNTEVVLPESGTVTSISTTVTDNAIARYDGTTGKLQNSSVVINDNGNVGIGTDASSGYKFDVLGGSGNGYRYSDGTTSVTLGVSTNIGQVGTLGAHRLDLLVGSVERVSITTFGNLLVGTTTDNGVDKLQVKGSITSISSSYKYNDLNNACTVDEKTIVDNNCLNIPYNDYGYVTIQVATPCYFCMQTFTALSAPARLFIRVLAGGVWSPWTEK